MNVDSNNQETNASQPLKLTRSQTATQRRRRQRLNQKRRAAELRCEDLAPITTSVNAVEESAAHSDVDRAVKKSMRRKQRRYQLKRAGAAVAATARAQTCDAGTDEKLLHLTKKAAAATSSPISTSTSSSSSINNYDISFEDLDFLHNPMSLSFSALLPTPTPSEGENNQTIELSNASGSVQSWLKSDQREPAAKHWQLREQMHMEWSKEVSSVQTKSQKWYWASSAHQRQYVHSHPYNRYSANALPRDQECNYCERRAYYMESNTYTQRGFNNNNNSSRSNCSVAQQPRQQQQQPQQVYQRKRQYEEYYPGQA